MDSEGEIKSPDTSSSDDVSDKGTSVYRTIGPTQPQEPGPRPENISEKVRSTREDIDKMSANVGKISSKLDLLEGRIERIEEDVMSEAEVLRSINKEVDVPGPNSSSSVHIKDLEYNFYRPFLKWSAVIFGISATFSIAEGSILALPLILAFCLMLWGWKLYWEV